VIRILTLGVIVTAAGCSAEEPGAPPPVPVVVADVGRATVPFELQATGTVEPLQTAAVRSQVTGILTGVNFREGQDVGTGQVLFQIDPRPFQAALQQAQANLARDEAQLANAEQEEARYQELLASGSVSPQLYEQIRTDAAALEATVSADRAAVEAARLNLQYATIRAPISGRAGDLLVREGNLVQANGDPLVVINQIAPILVRFTVPATNLPLIQEHLGDSLRVRAWKGGRSGLEAAPSAAVAPEGGGTMAPDGREAADGVGGTRPGPGAPAAAAAGPTSVSEGALTFVDNAVDSETGTILLKAQFGNPDGALWPGDFVNVAFELFREENAVVAPARALVQGQRGSYVFVVDDAGTASRRDVEVSRTIGDVAVVAGGLEGGETVVTEGQLRLTSGARVEVQEAGSGTAGRAGPEDDDAGADAEPDERQGAS
jgi:multidrug efflux system membrane fusion protein